jgi:hypothetical protein
VRHSRRARRAGGENERRAWWLLRLVLPAVLLDLVIHLFADLVDAEARWMLAWRVVDEGLEEAPALADASASRYAFLTAQS